MIQKKTENNVIYKYVCRPDSNVTFLKHRKGKISLCHPHGSIDQIFENICLKNSWVSLALLDILL